MLARAGVVSYCFFFFQAEDGIRDYKVTGVQTCALPISSRHATIPVINGLTDLSHPCQVLADLFTMREALGGWEGKRVAWVGDGNNMANSWIEAAQVLGFELRLACPEGFEPNRAMFDRARRPARASRSTKYPR